MSETITSRARVRALRGGNVESVHRIAAAVVDETGGLLLSLGDPELMTYYRSAAKPLQVIPLLEAGGETAFDFTSAELAVMAASHNGEKVHTDTVFSILSKIGLGEQNLFCGPHDPINEAANAALRAEGRSPTRVHNNCSGKHAGMLALCVLEGWPTEGYERPDHPLQRRIFEVIAEATRQEVSMVPHGVDGCGVPTFYCALRRMAGAYARLCAWSKTDGNRGDAVRRLFRAIREEPVLLDGTGGFGTDLVLATGGRMIGKVGAEGLFCIAVPQEGLGIAVKVEDGSRRATYPAVVELLKEMKLLARKEVDALAAHHRPVVLNRQQTEVGRIEPEVRLCR
jgi:L-asparaginase II